MEGKATTRKNEGAYAWKDVPPKTGDPETKEFKGKTYNWCTNHEHPQWSLHSPTSFPNLCKNHPKYAELEAAWTASGGQAKSEKKEKVSAADIQLESALANIESSDSESEDY